MWQIMIQELARAMHEMLIGFARFLPRFLEMLIIVVIGWIIAFVLKSLLRSVFSS